MCIRDRTSEFKSLYDWSLQELDADGKKVGHEQIPWKWNTYFTAIQLTYGDTITIGPGRTNHSNAEKLAVRERQFIHVKLHPGHPAEQGHNRETSYSMFGTDRTISNFDLYIEKLDDQEEQEGCTVWGSPRRTLEDHIDDETFDDCVTFRLSVRPEKFARYTAQISASAVDEAIFRVGEVAGFYSPWSPSISTNEIKVLTRDKEHKIELPSSCAISPPRLGAVGEAELYFRSVRILKPRKAETFEEANHSNSDGKIGKKLIDGVGLAQPSTAIADRAIGLLTSLRLVAWLIAGLLLMLIVTNNN